MKQCYEKLPHSCGTRNGLQVWQHEDGSYDGYCFSCGTYVKDPYGDEKPEPRTLKVKTPEQIKQELNEIQELDSHEIPERKLTHRVLKFYGVKVSLSEYDGQTPTATWYPYKRNGELVAYKCKTMNKDVFTKGNQRDCDPFGWDIAVRGDRYKIFITEGEDDTLALFRVLMQKGKWKSHPAVISLPNGAGNAAKSIERIRKQLESKFKEIVLCFDMDDAGRKAVSDVAKLIPGVKVAQYPLKDANDMLIAGREEELFQACMWEATSKVSGQSYRSSEIWHLAETSVEWGLEWPWSELTDLTRGRRRGEVYYFGAGVKMGKSVVVDQIAAHCITTQDTPVFLCKPEEPMGGTLKRIAGKVVGRIFHDPKIPFDTEAFAQAKKIVADKAIIYDAYQGVTWEAVKQEIRSAVMVAGVKDVFIDPLTCFTVGMTITQQNEALVQIASELASLALELDFTAYVFCHLNAPQSGPPHERGGAVQSVQFAGSRAMMRFCHMMIGIEGNKDPDLPDLEKDRRDLVLLEDRNFGESGRIKLQYSQQDGRLHEFKATLGE